MGIFDYQSGKSQGVVRDHVLGMNPVNTFSRQPYYMQMGTVRFLFLYLTHSFLLLS